MKQFNELIRQLEQHAEGEGRVSTLVGYFNSASDQDTIWAIALLTGKRPKRVVTINQLSIWAIEKTGFPVWLFKESQQQVGDLAETIARLLPPPAAREEIPLAEWIRSMISWQASAFEEQQECIALAWDQLEADERYLLNKLLSGGFRLRVSTVDLIRALQEVTGVPDHILAIRLAEKWDPQIMTMNRLMRTTTLEVDLAQPLSFHLIQTLKNPWSSLGNPADWWMEDQWEGIPIQLVRQDETIYLWTVEHQMVTSLFPEIEEVCKQIPEQTVLEGILLVMENDRPATQDQIQYRMDCQRVTKKIMHDKPACFIVHDCLVWKGKNIQLIPYLQRLQHVESICTSLDTPVIQCTHVKEVGSDWASAEDHLATARERHASGIILKHRNGHHSDEEISDVWWTMKAEPFQFDMVVLYVESGYNRLSGADYELTFGLWDATGFIPVTKTGHGLSTEDMDRVKAHVKEHTVERFGPVRQVVPQLVFTVQFDRVLGSFRHKSGITLLDSRICEWKAAKDVADLLPLSELKKWIK